MRMSGLGAELIEYLFDKPVVFAFGPRPHGGNAVGQAREQHKDSLRSDDPFTHAVLQLAVLSLSAGSVLALRS
jgi:hypothetical protein